MANHAYRIQELGRSREVRLKERAASVDTGNMMKWQSEAEMNAELRRIADEMRQLKQELKSYFPGESRPHRRVPALPIEDDRRLRDVLDEDRPGR